ncbi:MAG TPA: hypothetical protein VHE55_18090 [Fimbriimonadaceae bacterium]|nr:hypothetical protein [Fimbriimonadaceae bacterium]
MASVRSKFVTILQEAMEAGQVVSLYHQSHDADRFEVGFVDSVSATDVTLVCLTPRGEEDGRMAVRIEDITALEIDDPYSRKIQTLHSYRGSIFSREEGFRASSTSPSLEEQLLRAQEGGSVVTIEDASGTRFTGFVGELAEGYIEMKLLNQYGSPDGTAFLARHMLAKVDIGRREEQTRAFLYKIEHELRRLLEP